MNERLMEYAAGTLTPAERATVDAHLAGCDGCRADLATWAGIAAAAGPDVAPPGPALIRRVLARSVLSPVGPPARGGSGPNLDLVRAELRLLRVRVLVASAFVMALGVVLAVVQGGGAGDVLALVAPVVAAAGVSGVYGPRHDPAFEVVAATPTAQRLILLIRLTLVFGYDLILALAASAVVALLGGSVAGIWALVVAWLGPMALLSALSLLLVVWFGPDVAIGAALTLWSLRALSGSVLAQAGWLVDLTGVVWSTNLVTGLVAGVLAVAAVIVAGRGEPVRHSRATYLT